MKAMIRTDVARNTKYAILFVLLAALLASIPVVSAQGPTPTDDDVNKIAKKLFCPVCENTPLDVCPTEACRQWREQIRQMLIEGKTEDEIIQYFIDTYGVRASGDPPNKIASYLIPVTAILLGTAFLLRALQMWKKPKAAESTVPAGEAKQVHQDEYFNKLEDELKKRK
ncbi:MAG TPA: cytochrome c-type biogenesis protein CcmH [Anaerolineales bacterium]|nr:cytochrome c-type biogenesis protein CcmH [Anaerolineales bacterium]HNQ95419.1 cytochrome c-type biogenesis protein CcmH [Anaerolineales bacterium]HNS59644.1 cytochrome c-type biogenesis protein CcmH [Anaerolineales bacterium]